VRAQTVWRTVVEFLLIVVGVMVALAADSWRQSILERTHELRYLERLEADLEASRVQVADIRRQLDFLSDHGLTVLPYLRGEKAPDDVVGVLGSTYRASFGYLVKYVDATYREMTTGSGVGIIRNDTLRAAIVRTYEYENRNRAFDFETTDYVAYRDALRSTLPVEIQIELRKTCSATREPLTCVSDIAAPDALAALNLLRANPAVERGLNLWMQSVHQERNRLSGVQDQLAKVVAAIAAERAAAH